MIQTSSNYRSIKIPKTKVEKSRPHCANCCQLATKLVSFSATSFFSVPTVGAALGGSTGSGTCSTGDSGFSVACCITRSTENRPRSNIGAEWATTAGCTSNGLAGASTPLIPTSLSNAPHALEYEMESLWQIYHQWENSKAKWKAFHFHCPFCNSVLALHFKHRKIAPTWPI